MRKLVIMMIFIALIVAGSRAGYRAFKTELRTNLALNTTVANFTDKIDEARTGVADTFSNLKKKCKKLFKSISIRPASRQKPVQGIVLYFKKGGVISAKLLEKTKNAYTVEWKGEKFTIDVNKIDRVEYKTQKDLEWPHKNDVVVKRTNGVILDGEIIDVGEDKLTLLYREGGGRLELGVDRKDVEYLMFAPVYNRESREIEARLKELFPKMKFYKEGNVTIITDSYIRWVNTYKKTINAKYTELYLTFFELFKDERPQNQNFVVIFDDFLNYAEYALTDGVPFWMAVGYFDPIGKVLYLFNAFGEKMEKMVFDVIVGKTGKSIDEIVGAVKKTVDERYHVFIDGQVKEITDRYWDTYSFYKGELTAMTLETLRHEFTHEVFHNWGFQNIILSKPNIDEKELVEKKKEFLETKDCKKKEELLNSLIRIRKEEAEDLDMDAAQSWLAEGIATYCETDPIGSINEMWLFVYQEMARKNEVNPTEFLTTFKLGSFPGLCPKAMLNAYGQSWALTTFLMKKYQKEFLSYQKRLINQKHEGDEDELTWLLQCLDKDLPTLEREFSEYMATYEKVDDPDVKRFMRLHKIWSDLLGM